MPLPTRCWPLLALLCPTAQDPERARMLHEARELARTTTHHARLQRLVGTWDVTVRTTIPGAAPDVQRGSADGRVVLGGRHVVLNVDLRASAQRVEAMWLLGFDTLRQCYTSSWRDDASTWAVDCSGPEVADAPERLVLRGTLSDASDRGGRAFRLELDLASADRIRVRSYDTVGGAEQLVQEQDWVRR